jgi:hypothetical protein
LLSAAGLVAVALPFVFGLASATLGRAQIHAQSTATVAPTYEYEVVSIKANKTTGFPNATSGDDGFTVANIPLQPLLFQAFGVGPDRISGAPDWLNTEKYDINAKVDPAT